MIIARHQSGQVATEYVLLLVSILLAIIIATYTSNKNLIKLFSDEITSSFLTLTTLLKLPI